MEPRDVLFAHHASRPEAELDLAVAALLIAEVEYPTLDVAHYVSKFDDMAETVRASLADGGDPVAGLNEHLFTDLGFRGNEVDYYDPKNSFLNEVIDRRVGIPITLSVVYLEVGRRLGLDLVGVSFPGHFLVLRRTEANPTGTLIDPYHGGTGVERSKLEERLRQALGPGTKLSAEHLQPASKRQILVRMLNNLRGIYQRAGDPTRERACVERLSILNAGGETKSRGQAS